tara:strand:- start:39046 stop:44742 length:5697 start_codon:yes stop_codon:yes gene_type:complete
MFNNNQAPIAHTTPKAIDAPITRNGSAILIVVGTLALIAVFAAIYISIGQSDQRVKRSIENKQEIEANSNTIAEHVLDVLAKDRLGYTTQRNENGVFAVRDATDSPYTDWTMRSESNNEWEWFNPAGRHSSLGTQPNQSEDFRVSSDPYLASTSPTYLGNPGQPISNDLRPFGSLITQGSIQPSDFIAGIYSSGFLDKRDWLQISNLAPDGRVVNLFNLRAGNALSNGFADNSYGGFDSEPGTGTFTRPSDGRTVRRMSEYLSLWNQETPGDPESRIITHDPLDMNTVWIPGRNEPVDVGLTAAEIQNTPAVWTMYQRFMFQPINQPFMTVNRNNRVSTWADPDYAPYQYADADGDGMADSRWIELTSAQDTQSGNNNPRDDIERLYDAGNSRIFAAIRVMDLSSLVNVNTAMEQLTEPDPFDGGTLGYTPADVDLRRLLSLSDVGHNYSILQLAGLSPSSFHKPTLTSNNDLLDPDYKWYRNYIDPTSSSPKVIEPSSNALSIGRYGYSAIKLGIEEGGTLDERYTAWPPVLREMNDASVPAAVMDSDFDETFNPPNAEYDPNSDYRLKQYHRDPSTPESTDPMTERQRSEWYMNIGRLDPLTTDQVKASQNYPDPPGYAAGSLYNKDDLLELLSFHGLNDPATVSRLEKAAMGRMPSVFGQNQRAFSPLLSNRPLSLDRERHGFIDESAYTIAATDQPRRINGSIAKESMVFFSVTPRRLLTTVSGGSAILPGSLINPTLPTLTAGEAAPVLTDAFENTGTLFSIYSNALVGELDATKVFPSTIEDVFVEDPSLARDEETATLFYGHRTPELALRIAAHMAVNSADMYDADNEPTAATLLLDDSLRTDFQMNPLDLSEYLKYAGMSQGNLFDPGEARTPNNHFSAGEQDARRAVNVFGIEPMPFIAEVASMYVYTDSASGDEDYLSDGRVPRPPRPGFSGPVIPAGSDGDPALVPVTIDGTVQESNQDLMMQVLAFQLTNPWSEDIILGGTDDTAEPMGYIDDDPSPSNTTLKFDYYIEFGGRFFKLGEFVEFNPPLTPIYDPAQYPDAPFDGTNGVTITSTDPTHVEYQYRSATIPAGESRVFYAIAHSRFDGAGDTLSALDEKWLAEVGSFTDDGQDWTGPAEEWINRQFSINGGVTPIHIHQFDPRDGSIIEENQFHDLLDANAVNIDPAEFIYSDADRNHDTSKVRLWRKIVGTLEEDLVSNPDPGVIDGNYIQNDMLVDRFDLGSSSFLQRPIVSSGTTEEPWQIEGSVGYDPALYDSGDVSSIGVRNDNFGLSVVRWASMRRGDNFDPDIADVNTGPAEHFQGQVASWMLSSRRDPSFNTQISEDQFSDNGGILTIEDFLDDTLENLRSPTNNAPIRPEYEVHETFADLLNLNSNQAVVQTIAREPQDKWELNSDAYNPFDDIVMRDKFPQLSLIANNAGQDLHAEDSLLVPEILPNANQFNEAPRLADLLLAWGIGPTYIPDIGLTANAGTVAFDADDERRWITLPEAIAIALGYENITSANYLESEPNADIVWMDAVTSEESLLDNGHLSIDNYVAYFNADTSEDPPEFDYLDDIRRGTGAPMALGVLDQVRAIAPLDSSADQLITPTFGQININTAPVEVLRLLPGLSPNLSSYYPNIALSTAEPEWWGQNDSWDLPDLTTPSTTPDVAAAIVGYRDRLFVEPRSRSADTAQQDFNPLNYASADPDDNNSYDNSASHANNLMDEETPDLATDSDGDHRDRQTISGIDGMRQTPGFGSLGEILAVSFGPDAQGAGQGVSSPVALRTAQPQLSIQQYFHDDLNLDGDPDVVVAMDPQLFGGETNGATINDYAERLAMANGVLNMISVRSDYFAVWFVIHAYQESDVTNLQPEDPLIPSLAKRYVMVVDRTNVTDPGDTPRIVLLREVPM